MRWLCSAGLALAIWGIAVAASALEGLPQEPAKSAPETASSPAPSGTAPLPNPTPLPMTGPWHPPAHSKNEKDWVQLKGGEWVHGKIERIEEEVVYFDSDELDDLEIDWSDVATFRSARRNTYRFEGSIIVTGTAAMRDKVIRVDTGAGIVEFPSAHLFSMIEGDLRELNYWSLGASVGVTLRSGNSNQSDVTVGVDVERETPLTDLTISYDSANSTVEGEVVTDNQRLSGVLQINVTERAFLIAPFADAFRDKFQNIDIRATLAGGAGYEVIDRPRAEWRVGGAVGYQRTNFDTVQIDEEDSANDAALVFFTSLELDPTKDIDWDTSYRVDVVVTDLDKTNHHLQSVWSVDLFKTAIDLDLTFTWDRIEGPQPDDAGNVPKSDDFRLTIGLGLDF